MLICLFLSAAIFGQVGIGTNTPDSSAVLDLQSANRGFLPPRMTDDEIAGIGSPANGLIVFCTSDNKLYAYTESESVWKEVQFGSGTIYEIITCGEYTINHVAGNVAPVTKTVTYSAVTNIPGEESKCWISSNLGADHQADSVDDPTEASAGWYWQFNHMQGYKHDGTTRTPNTTWIDWIEDAFPWLAANDPCTLELGSMWRLPTLSEWTNVDAAGGWTDWNGPWKSHLKMHAAGLLAYFDGTLFERGTTGRYWSSNQDTGFLGWNLAFHSSWCGIITNEKANAYPVRCLKD